MVRKYYFSLQQRDIQWPDSPPSCSNVDPSIDERLLDLGGLKRGCLY